ncbi:uncharacterized protein ASCRUDRAFT_77675 [Ascoidea rubescens DSM 1968]|uniref:L domain-like protein n=1 Tax=Ascoidea rubescens DSM 1968 TaxID=1344418 RepID=A0A1D2VAH8_9ASCO|nr:hypothetical protein ASCRUDRAFT_77675 [Ascoidea rubescens DSM 1968]ODV58664.1 hypothetical protein ASCRUDRAFT_77675 [Ascoidea rubescens DSM 1968]
MTLNLSNNQIDQIKIDDFENLKSLKILDLSINLLFKKFIKNTKENEEDYDNYNEELIIEYFEKLPNLKYLSLEKDVLVENFRIPEFEFKRTISDNISLYSVD